MINTLVNICTQQYAVIWNLLGIIVNIIKIGIPILLIIFGMIDFAKTMITKDESEQKKASKLLFKRFLYAVGVFSVVWIVTLTLSIISGAFGEDDMEYDEASWKECWALIVGRRTNSEESKPASVPTEPDSIPKSEPTPAATEPDPIPKSEPTPAATEPEINEYIPNQSVLEAQKEIESYIKSKSYSISVGYYNLKNGYVYKYNKNKVYYGASTIKILDGLYYYTHQDKLNDTVRERLVKAITYSENNPHLLNIDDIGLDEYRKYGLSLGVEKEIMDTVGTDTGVGSFGNTNVDTQLTYLIKLYNVINSVRNGEELKSYFINNKVNCLKFAGIPNDVMHKYGYKGNYFHDVGIVLDNDNPYVVIILTEGAQVDANCVNIKVGNKCSITELSEKIYKMNKKI